MGWLLFPVLFFMGQKIGTSNQSIQTDEEDVSKLCAVDNV
jgi:hypothetical protein